MTKTPSFAGLKLLHRYANLPDAFYSSIKPTPVAQPVLGGLNLKLIEDLGFDGCAFSKDSIVRILSGNQTVSGSRPVACVYAGHQFGHFVPQLGDGRAVLLGEVVDRLGNLWDMQLKGCGKTPYSRNGDGRAALGPVIREFVMSEAMHALGIPTSRSLAFVTSGESVERETALPGAILTRIAASHIRIGTFEYFAARHDHDSVKTLADFSIERHYAHVHSSDSPYVDFFRCVIERQAKLIAQWLGVGFIHGVMNTDNMTISGETIDYGPCAFMDVYDEGAAFSSIDHYGRYAYGNQAAIGQWNLSRLAEALLPLFDDDLERAVDVAQDSLSDFKTCFERAWLAVMSRKLGCGDGCDVTLIEEFLALLQGSKLDFTLAFRALCDIAEVGQRHLAKQTFFPANKRWEAWFAKWLKTVSAGMETADAMRQVNPAYIPRNHQMEQVIDAAVQHGDYSSMHAFIKVLGQPYLERDGFEKYSLGPREDERVVETFCGT